MQEENKYISEHESFWNNFKAFALRGNVIDLAIGLIVGVAFNNLITSLVNNIVMPPIGKLIGNADFSHLYINLNNVSYESLAAAEAAGAPILKYGQFTTDLINFFLIALTVFIIVRYVLRYRLEKRKD